MIVVLSIKCLATLLKAPGYLNISIFWNFAQAESIEDLRVRTKSFPSPVNANSLSSATFAASGGLALEC